MDIRTRYLDLLRSSLINELYIENDLRLLYMAGAIAIGTRMDPEVLRNIGSNLPDALEKLRRDRREGSPWWNVPVRKNDGTTEIVNLRNYCEFTHSMIGQLRMKNIEQCLDVVRNREIKGDLVETGVWRGGSAVFMRGYLEAYEMVDRRVWAADSYEGLPKPSHPADEGLDYSAEVMPILAVSLPEVKGIFSRYGLLDDRVQFLKGWFRDTLPAAPIERIALLRLDGDLYESTWDALSALYSKVTSGGFILVDDYGDFPPCKKAIDDFRAAHGINDPIQRVDWTGVYWQKR